MPATTKRSRAKLTDQTVPLRLEKRLKVSGGITVREHTSRHIWTLKIDVTDAKVGAVFEIDHDPQESPYDSEEEAVSSAFWGLIEWVDDLRLSYPEESQRLVDVRAQLLAQASRLLGAGLDRHRPMSTPRSIPETQEQAAAKASAADNPAAVHSLVSGKTAWLCRGCGTHNDGAETECGKCGAAVTPQSFTDLNGQQVPPKKPARKKAGKEIGSRAETPSEPSETSVATPESLREIPLSAIVPSDINPRRTFDGDALDELAESIRTHGLLQPIVVMALPDWMRRGTQHRYEIIAGERRYRAARLAGRESILCRVLDCTAEQAIELRVTENLQREDLSPIEEARGFAQLIEHCGYSQRDLAARLGVSQGKIGNALGLLRLPEDWQERLSRREITATMARDLVPHADDDITLTLAIDLLESRSDWSARAWTDAVRAIAQDGAPSRDQAEGMESTTGREAHPSDPAAGESDTAPFGPPPVRPAKLEEYRSRWLTEAWVAALANLESDEQTERALKSLGVTIQSHWRVDREFLELFRKAELFELASSEWHLFLVGDSNVYTVDSQKLTRQQLIDEILAEDARKPLPLPRCLR